MKKTYISLAFLSLFALMSFDNLDCSILKNNTFTYRNAKKDVLVVFKDKKHVEYHNNMAHYIKSDIDWVSDCEYYLEIKETTLPNFPFKMGTRLHIKITKVSGKKVYYTSSLAGRTWEGRLTKVKRKIFE
ncbi:hypothetical protein MC378_12435 [Polaribacter sp. MSW13]|uniref:Uncharacterized protein n=1 Tax=Polaribacter marinus TaxID=2916838 RepID=A0A9X2AKE4_9FLAO|nr:hypothetical protein [Polaribacter marinus]MCI2229977.1 hypothetical protein [Polaribacter marinus]